MIKVQRFILIIAVCVSVCAFMQHSQVEQLEWKFPIGSMYEFTSIKNFSVLVSQASCLIMGS